MLNTKMMKTSCLNGCATEKRRIDRHHVNVILMHAIVRSPIILSGWLLAVYLSLFGNLLLVGLRITVV